MRKETEFALMSAISSSRLTAQDMGALFDIYTEHEITSIEDLFRNHSQFHSFIIENLEFFQNSNKLEIVNTAVKKVKSFMPISDKYQKHQRKPMEDFAHQIEELVCHDKSVKILEVGSGAIPYSSILLGADGYDITTMDTFAVSPECLSKLNVKSNRQLFSAKTSVRDYDIVVGRRPCTAIEYIVTNCSDEKIPYFLRLCACNAPYKNTSAWRQVLSEIDSGIKYHSAYAYNLDSASFEKPSSINDIVEMDPDRTLF